MAVAFVEPVDAPRVTYVDRMIVFSDNMRSQNMPKSKKYWYVVFWKKAEELIDLLVGLKCWVVSSAVSTRIPPVHSGMSKLTPERRVYVWKLTEDGHNYLANGEGAFYTQMYPADHDHEEYCWFKDYLNYADSICFFCLFEAYHSDGIVPGAGDYFFVYSQDRPIDAYTEFLTGKGGKQWACCRRTIDPYWDCLKKLPEKMPCTVHIWTLPDSLRKEVCEMEGRILYAECKHDHETEECWLEDRNRFVQVTCLKCITFNNVYPRRKEAREKLLAEGENPWRCGFTLNKDEAEPKEDVEVSCVPCTMYYGII